MTSGLLTSKFSGRKLRLVAAAMAAIAGSLVFATRPFGLSVRQDPGKTRPCRPSRLSQLSQTAQEAT